MPGATADIGGRTPAGGSDLGERWGYGFDVLRPSLVPLAIDTTARAMRRASIPNCLRWPPRGVVRPMKYRLGAWAAVLPTNKPGWTGAVTAGVVGLILGLLAQACLRTGPPVVGNDQQDNRQSRPHQQRPHQPRRRVDEPDAHLGPRANRTSETTGRPASHQPPAKAR